MTYLTAFLEIFRFIKRYRERAEQRWMREADERAAERTHQREMLATIFSKMVEANRVSQEGLTSIAEASQAQARVMQTWLDGFRIQDPTPTPPQVVRDDEQWLQEQLRLNGMGLPVDVPFEVPAELKLALELRQQEHDSDAPSYEENI